MSDYYSIPTTLGAARLAAAANSEQALTLSHMAFGDANGVPYLPNSRVNAAALVNERYRIAVQYVVQDAQNPNVFIIKARIPASIGGFDVCEIGIFDTNGELIYLANYPRTFKPQITQGAGGELTIRIHVMTSHSSSISIILDPHVITLTQAEGDNRYALKTQLDDEAATRANIDNILGDAINNEAAIRLTQDLALSIAIAAEITNRENALANKADKYGDLNIIFDVAYGWLNRHAANIQLVSDYINNRISLLALPKSMGRFRNINSNQIQYSNFINLASVTRWTGGGLAQIWEVFFINPMPSTDYIVVGNVSFGGGYGGRSFEPFDYQHNSFKIRSMWGGDNSAGESQDDSAIVNFVVY